MKKYNIALLVLVFALGFFTFNIDFSNAYDAGCTGAGPYSTTTGQPCGTLPSVDCLPGHLFSSLTGKPCGTIIDNGGPVGDHDEISDVGLFNTLLKSYFKIGSRGDEVRALQEFLKEKGYYFGKLDGKYGRITARAVKDFQEDNDISTVPTPIPAPLPTPLPEPLPQPCEKGNYLCDDSSKNQSPVISGVSLTPQSLKVGEKGTWTVNAYDPNNQSLSYYVVWGDELVATSASDLTYQKPTVYQQSATFTHVYYQAGTYQPRFTVYNSRQSAETSVTVIVSAGATKQNSLPVIKALPPVPSLIKVNQSVNFNFNAYDPDNDDLSWAIDWGDTVIIQGSPSGGGGGSTSVACSIYGPKQSGYGQSFSANHAWNTAGTYKEVTVHVSDCRGGEAKTSFTVTVGQTSEQTPKIISILPAGCSSNTGYSSVTGESCANNRTSANFGETVYVYGENFNFSTYGSYSVVTDRTFGGNDDNLIMLVTNNISPSLLSFVVPSDYGSGVHLISVHNDRNPFASNSVNLNFVSTTNNNLAIVLPSESFTHFKVGESQANFIYGTGINLGTSYSFFLDANSFLPTGLGLVYGNDCPSKSIYPACAEISGIPTSSGTWKFNLVFASSSSRVTKEIILVVDPATPTVSQSLNISLAANSPTSQAVTPGTKKSVLSTINLTAGNSANVTVSKLNFGVSGDAGPYITNLRLIPGYVTADASNPLLFDLKNYMIIAKGNTYTFTLIGDISFDAPIGSKFLVALAGQNVTLGGQTAGAGVTGSAWPSDYTHTVIAQPPKVDPTLTFDNFATGFNTTGVVNIGSIVVKAGSDNITINSIPIKLTMGEAVLTSSAPGYKTNGLIVKGLDGQFITTTNDPLQTNIGGTSVINFVNGYRISSGTSMTFRIFTSVSEVDNTNPDKSPFGILSQGPGIFGYTY